MSQQNIYQIQLLNDLHNYFPEILYNPRRFNNVQDLLEYIIEVSNITPYTRGRQQYYNRQNNTTTTRVSPNPRQNYIPPPPPSTPPTTVPGVSWVNNSTIPQTYFTTFGFDENPTTRVRMSYNNNNVLMNTLLGGLFGDILSGQPLGGINLNTFLNERVPVYPTNEEISNASTTFRANRRQDDICAICQEDIDAGQEARRITHCNHYFHRDCIDTWFRGNVHCPTCRHDIRETNTNSTAPPPVPENYRRTNIRSENMNN